jgi:hypothetical protein
VFDERTDGFRVQDFRACACEVGGFFVRKARDVSSRRDKARVGGQDAGRVRPNFDDARAGDGGDDRRGIIRTVAPERRRRAAQ